MKKLNNKTVEGDGFVITVPDIHHARYSHGQFVAEVEIEGGSEGGQVDWLLYASTLGAKDEKSVEFVNRHRQRILDRISNALTILGMPHSIT
ncbi:MAG: hypothetical protein A3K19_18520 [Lentisphaerae bacterium RIFOXYB12_FULL_65_16]|nr:MAG: hypothetical protein A3K18_14265 [Lentisphaerae bacterium RIFOXYA12_64_32]OGV94919.1 MAG: hypothetical protein A3K19_18520 [Lentisphaerae bacterium RIFOXYB12_FULL_65_16]